MPANGFTEKDWRFFRSRIADWQESYMDKLNREYIALLDGSGNPSDKFWELEQRIKEDKKKVGVHAEMSRSNMIHNIMSLIQDEAIGIEDLDGFSDEFRDKIIFFMGNEGG